MKTIINIFNDFLNLIYPNVCEICDESLVFNEKNFCTNCLGDFPFTKYNSFTENDMAGLFWGRIDIKGAYALFYFLKNSKYRVLLHKLKYKGEKEIGIELGKMLGDALKGSEMDGADYIIPLPLHRKKKTHRGYNQCDYIARGMNEVLQIEVNDRYVERVLYNITQTGKGRYERWENVQGIFKVSPLADFKGKKIIIVDDIVTTGSTMEACAAAIKQIFDCDIYLCSLAVTKI